LDYIIFAIGNNKYVEIRINNNQHSHGSYSVQEPFLKYFNTNHPLSAGQGSGNSSKMRRDQVSLFLLGVSSE
jgi:hypothetical protein